MTATPVTHEPATTLSFPAMSAWNPSRATSAESSLFPVAVLVCCASAPERGPLPGAATRVTKGAARGRLDSPGFGAFRRCSTYQVTFMAPPPAQALNEGQLGVGIVLLTTGTGLHSGMKLEDAPANTVLLGGTGNYAVIYKAVDNVTRVDWAGAFPLGFGAGVGVERPLDFDALAPTEATGLELVVDDIDNIDFVNRT